MCDVPAQAILSRFIEPLAALSILHLCPETRRKLAADELSVHAYPNDYGGFVYVGEGGSDVPTEPDLAAIFVAALAAHVIWLKFDCDAAVVDGLPLFEGDDAEDLS